MLQTWICLISLKLFRQMSSNVPFIVRAKKIWANRFTRNVLSRLHGYYKARSERFLGWISAQCRPMICAGDHVNGGAIILCDRFHTKKVSKIPWQCIFFGRVSARRLGFQKERSTCDAANIRRRLSCLNSMIGLLPHPPPRKLPPPGKFLGGGYEKSSGGTVQPCCHPPRSC